MTLKKTLSFCLALTLILSILAPCGILQASASTTLYGEKELEQVTEPVIGESYYLGADVEGTMMYFRHGTVTDTVPYSLVTTDNINHNWCYKLTLEDSTATSENFEGGFQFTYNNPSNNKLSRIYCMDVLKDATVSGQTGVMDTGVNTADPYKNRHSFHIANIEGNTVLQKYGNDNILVIKQVPQTVDGEAVLVWRMLGVPATELSNDGVYPVMLLTEHNHNFGAPVADAASDSVSRTCSCGQSKTVYDQKVQNVNNPVVGNQYYLTANVDGTIRYFIHGTVSESTPASLRTSDDFYHNWSLPFTLEAPVEGEEGFQLVYTNPTNGNLARIYCYDSIGSDGVADTGANGKSELNKHTFTVDGGYIKNLGNDHVLVVKEMAFIRNVKDEEGNVTVQEGTELRILGVPAEELSNEGVYPVFLTEKHTHIAYGETYQISDEGHAPICWCGGYADAIAHTYGDITADTENNTHSRSCTVCGYTNVIYGYDYQQANFPVVGNSYYLAANVNGQLMSFLANGGYTGTTPYSLNTSTAMSRVTLNEALEEGKGEFQLVADDGKYIYSIAAGAGATTSSGYITVPERVSFFMDEVNGQKVIRAYGTNNILVIKYSEEKAVWRMWALSEDELANEGVYPVVLMEEHAHSYGAWSFDAENGTQSQTCEICGYVNTLYGTDNKVSMVTEPVIGESYYLVANVDGTIYFFRHGSATETVPYSLVATDNFAHNWVRQVTIEDPTTTNEKITTGFQLTYINPTTEATSRIYCYDVLKDATVAGQTGVMDTGINSANYKNRHNFTVEQINGQTVLHKTGNNNVLVLKELEYSRKVTDATGNETVQTGTELRILGVPQSELGTEGVYPVMLANVHTHSFGEECYSDENGHWHVCDCGSRSAVEAHHLGQWELDGAAKTQTASCAVCDYSLTVNSPYFDYVNDEAELNSGLAEIIHDEETDIYSVEGGNGYYLTTEKDGQRYYFRLTVRTEAGNPESVTTTPAYSLYSTNDPSHRALTEIQVVAGYTEGTYILTTTTDATRVIYVNNEGKDDDIDVGITAFKGASDNATYIARAEAMWDAENGNLYHLENGVKYVLVLKEMEATYKGTDENGESIVVEGPVNEWRIAAVPVSEATEENGCYILKLAQHEHNYPVNYTVDNENHWRICPCGHKAEEAHNVEQWAVIAPPTETETGSKTGECTVCGATITVETPVTVSGWNIVLGDNIGVNFVLALAKGDTVIVTVAGQEVPAELIDNGNGTFKVFIKLAAAQMADEIVISVNGYAVEKTYSVRAYADAILAGEYTSYTKNLVSNMLVYGSAAQTYFKHNLDNLAGNDIELTLAEPGEAPELVVVNELTGIKYYGASLLHKEKTAVRFYFTADSIENLIFQVDGNIYEPVSKDGMYYIDVAEINPQDLDDTLNVVVTDGTNSLAVQYSPLIYISRMYHKSGSNAANKAMVQAMYNYHLAAKAYLANLNLSDDFAVKAQTESVLYEGVTLYEKTYVAAGYGEVVAHILQINADANVELKISAGAWDETNNAENPAEAKTVANHFRAVKSAGYNVLAMINGGFFDLNNTKSYVPYGVQIVDGEVKQAPSTDNNYSNNWFGMTKDGKYVISNAAGYADYEGNIQQAVGGGKLLIVDGVPVDLSSSRDYRTAVGVNANGDLVMVAVENATYSDVCHIFVDMGLDIVTVLNLDGGGSTAMYVPGAYYPQALILGEDGFFPRKVADAVAIVEKN